MALTWMDLRRALARARMARQRDSDGRPWTLDDLARASGVDKSTIHRIENTKKYQHYKPELETLEAIVVRGLGQPLSAFFAQFEAAPRKSLNRPDELSQNRRAPLKDADAAAVSLDPAFVLSRLDAFTARTEQRLARLEKRPESHSEQSSTPRPDRPGGGKRRAQ